MGVILGRDQCDARRVVSCAKSNASDASCILTSMMHRQGGNFTKSFGEIAEVRLPDGSTPLPLKEHCSEGLDEMLEVHNLLPLVPRKVLFAVVVLSLEWRTKVRRVGAEAVLRTV